MASPRIASIFRQPRPAAPTAASGTTPGSRARAGLLCLCAGLALLAGRADAFEALNPAQALIYDRAHLANTAQGETIRYAYSGTDAGTPAVDDVATLSVTAAGADDERDVSLEFLTGERRIELPPFEGWRGNPVLIAMLERVAEDMGANAGAGTLYFRNRIRDALAGDATTIEEVEGRLGDEAVPATRLSFRPFARDAYVGARPAFASAEFSVVLSDAVPGGVVSIGVDSLANDAAGFHRQLHIEP